MMTHDRISRHDQDMVVRMIDGMTAARQKRR